MKDIIIIPTYNEKENIRKILEHVGGLYPEMEIWIVDDSSPDGTQSIVSEMMEKNTRIKLFVRSLKTGLGDAYKYILSHVQSKNDVRHIVTMDADGSHDPASVRLLIEALTHHDLAIGSRYVRGGKVVGWDFKRLVLSYFGNIYSRFVTGLPVRDSTAGFVAFRFDALRTVDLGAISSAGYSYQIEFKGAMVKQGKTFREIPITFTERQMGKSKMSGHIILEGLLMPWRILAKDRTAMWRRIGNIAAGVVFLAALFFATFHLTESPSVWYDEGIYIQSAVNALEYKQVGFQFSPNVITHVSRVSVSYPFIYPLALWFKIFGTSIFSARLFMVLILMSFLLVTYLLTRRLYGNFVALGTLLLLATFPPLYGNGKSVLGEVPGLLYLSLSLLCFNVFRSNSTKKDVWLVFAGLFLGLAVVIKTIFIVLVPSIAVLLFFEWKRSSMRLREIIILALSVALPFLAWLIIQFQASDSFSSIVGFYVNPYQVKNLTEVIVENIKNFIFSATPLYLLAMMMVWLAALILRSLRKILIPSEEIMSFVFCCLIIVAYLRIAGWYRYIFPAQIVAIIYFVSSLKYLADWFCGRHNRKFSVLSKHTNTYIFVLVLTIAIFGVYGVIFNSWVADSYMSHKTAFWQEYFKKIPSNQSFFFYNVPEVAIFSQNRNYYQFIEPTGGPFSVKELEAIDNGVIDKIIVKTDALVDISSRLKKYYHPDQEVYKYTILNKNTKR